MIKKLIKMPKQLLLLNFLFILISVVFSYYNGFCWITDSLSSFGTFNDFFNFSLILSGISLGVFTISVVDKSYDCFWTRIFLLLSSICLIFIGIFTERYLIHLVFAVVLFAVFPFGLFLLGRSLKGVNSRLGLITKIIGIFLILLWVGFFIIWEFVFPLGLAIPEMISLFAWITWSLIFIKNFKAKPNYEN